MHVVSLQPAMVYGPCSRGNLPRLIHLVERGLCPQIPETHAYRSVVSVHNAVDALLLVEGPREAAGKRYIVADDIAYSTHQIINTIAAALGRRPPRLTAPMWLLRSAAAMGDALSALRGRRVLFDSRELEKLVGPAWFSADRLVRELDYRPQGTLATAMPGIVAARRGRTS
jgi:UDP-glucose 4-epimerase